MVILRFGLPGGEISKPIARSMSIAHSRSMVSWRLAPLADVIGGAENELSSDALLAVMGGTPSESPGAYRNGCPTALLPVGIPQVIIVGSEDQSMLANARRYTEDAAAAGDDAQLIVFAGAGHFEIVAVDSDEWRVVREAVQKLGKSLR